MISKRVSKATLFASGVALAAVWMSLLPTGAPNHVLAAQRPATANSPATSGCGGCHASMTQHQPHTGMGMALQTTGADQALSAHPHLSVTNAGYTYVVNTIAGKSTYTVSDGKQKVELPIRWAFGANNQTFLLEQNGSLYESVVSYYARIGALAVTTGDDTYQPKNIEEAIGRKQSANDVKACFGCHATGAIENGALNLNHLKPGLGCEHCHTQSAEHEADFLRGKHMVVPEDLGALSPEQMSGFCGQCHRTWEMVVRSRWRGEMNVRFQPYRLANSRCFNGTDPRIGCVACHNPHEDVERTPAYYDEKCLACHGASANHGKTVALAETPKLCPVAKSNCTQCHMPKVTLPHSGGQLTFTDHEIRIVRAQTKYPD